MKTRIRKSRKDKITQKGGNSANTLITIPYLPELSEKRKITFRQSDIRVSFKPGNTVRQKIVHLKDKLYKNIKCELLYGNNVLVIIVQARMQISRGYYSGSRAKVVQERGQGAIYERTVTIIEQNRGSTILTETKLEPSSIRSP